MAGSIVTTDGSLENSASRHEIFRATSCASGLLKDVHATLAVHFNKGDRRLTRYLTPIPSPKSPCLRMSLV